VTVKVVIFQNGRYGLTTVVRNFSISEHVVARARVIERHFRSVEKNWAKSDVISWFCRSFSRFRRPCDGCFAYDCNSPAISPERVCKKENYENEQALFLKRLVRVFCFQSVPRRSVTFRVSIVIPFECLLYNKWT